MESILLDTMFDLPGLDGVEQVVIGPEVVEGKARPLYIYAERAERANSPPFDGPLETRAAPAHL